MERIPYGLLVFTHDMKLRLEYCPFSGAVVVYLFDRLTRYKNGVSNLRVGEYYASNDNSKLAYKLGIF